MTGMNRETVPFTPALPVSNSCFRLFWHITFGKKETVPLALFISSLESYCAVGLPPGVHADEVDERTGCVPLNVRGYAVDETTYRTLFRTHINDITKSFNVKGYSDVTNSNISVYELQSCTKYLPRNASLVQCLFLIARQGGFKYILPQEMLMLKDDAINGGKKRDAAKCSYESVFRDFIVTDCEECDKFHSYVDYLYSEAIRANGGMCCVFSSCYNSIYFGNMPCYLSSLLQQCLRTSRDKSDIFLFDLADCNNESDIFFAMANTLSYYGYCDVDSNILNISDGYRKMRRYILRYLNNMKCNSVVIFSNVPSKEVFDVLMDGFVTKKMMYVRHKVVIVLKSEIHINEVSGGVLKYFEITEFDKDITLKLFNSFQNDKVSSVMAEKIIDLSGRNIEIMKLVVSLPKDTLCKILNFDNSTGLLSTYSNSPKLLYFAILYHARVFSVDEILLIKYIHELNHSIYNCTFDIDILWHLVKEHFSSETRAEFLKSFNNLESLHIIKIVDTKSISCENKGSYQINVEINSSEIIAKKSFDFHCLITEYFFYFVDLIKKFNVDIKLLCYSEELEINNNRDGKDSLTQIVVKNSKSFAAFYFICSILLACERYHKLSVINKLNELCVKVDEITSGIRNTVKIHNPFSYTNSNKVIDALLKNEDINKILCAISGNLNSFSRLLLPANMGINLMLYSLNAVNNSLHSGMSTVCEGFFDLGCVLLMKQRHLLDARKSFSFVIEKFEESGRDDLNSKYDMPIYFLSCYFVNYSLALSNDATIIADTKSYLTKLILSITKFHLQNNCNIRDVTYLVTKRLLLSAFKYFGDVLITELGHLIGARKHKINDNFKRMRNSKGMQAIYDEYNRGSDDETLYFKKTQQLLSAILFDIENVTNMSGVVNNFETKLNRYYYNDASSYTSFVISSEREKELLRKARQLFIQSIVGYKKLYGEDSLTAADFTVHMLNKLSPFFKNISNESIIAYKEVIKVYERNNVYVSDRMALAYTSLADLCVLSNRNGQNISYDYGDSNHFTQLVQRYYSNSVGILKNLHDCESKLIISTLNKLAIFFILKKENNHLMHMFETELISYRKRIENNSNKTKIVDYQISNMLCIIASVCFLNRQYAKALAFYNESVTIYKIFDDTHLLHLAEVIALQVLCQNKQNIVEDFDSKDNLNDTNHPIYLSAINTLNETIFQLNNREYGNNHLVTLLLQVQGKIHLSRNNFSGFQSIYDHILQKYPENTILTNEICDLKLEFGIFLCTYGQLYEGKVVLEHAINNFQTLYGDESMKLFEATFAIATAHYGLKLYDDALDFAEDATIVAAKAEGKECIRIADCHNLIAMVFQDLEEYDEARTAYSEAIRVYAKHPHDASYDANVAKVLHNLGTLYDDIDDIESSAYFYERSLNILKIIDLDRSLDAMAMIPLAITAIENLSTMLEDTDSSTFLSLMGGSGKNSTSKGKISEISKIISRLEDTAIKIAPRRKKGPKQKKAAGADATIENTSESMRSEVDHDNLFLHNVEEKDRRKIKSGCVIV